MSACKQLAAYDRLRTRQTYRTLPYCEGCRAHPFP